MSESGLKMEAPAKVSIDGLRLVKIWWAISWRTVVVGFVGSACLALCGGLLMHSMGAQIGDIQSWSRAIALVGLVPGGIWAVRAALGKRYSDFQLRVDIDS